MTCPIAACPPSSPVAVSLNSSWSPPSSLVLTGQPVEELFTIGAKVKRMCWWLSPSGFQGKMVGILSSFMSAVSNSA